MPPKKQRIHVFMGNSNVFGGAQNAAAKHESHVPWQAVRVYIKNLVKLVEADRKAVTRVLAGSVPPGNDEQWRRGQADGHTRLLWSKWCWQRTGGADDQTT